MRDRVLAGLDAGRDLREWTFVDEQVETVTADVDAGEYVTTVVLAAYGDSDPIC